MPWSTTSTTAFPENNVGDQRLNSHFASPVWRSLAVWKQQQKQLYLFDNPQEDFEQNKKEIDEII